MGNTQIYTTNEYKVDLLLRLRGLRWWTRRGERVEVNDQTDHNETLRLRQKTWNSDTRGFPALQSITASPSPYSLYEREFEIHIVLVRYTKGTILWRLAPHTRSTHTRCSSPPLAAYTCCSSLHSGLWDVIVSCFYFPLSNTVVDWLSIKSDLFTHYLWFTFDPEIVHLYLLLFNSTLFAHYHLIPISSIYTSISIPQSPYIWSQSRH